MTRRVELTVTVDLDPVPGAFHTDTDTAVRVERILLENIRHYNPRVTVTNVFERSDDHLPPPASQHHVITPTDRGDDPWDHPIRPHDDQQV